MPQYWRIIRALLEIHLTKSKTKTQRINFPSNKIYDKAKFKRIYKNTKVCNIQQGKGHNVWPPNTCQAYKEAEAQSKMRMLRLTDGSKLT